MKKELLVSENDFVQLFTDCKGYSDDEARGLYDEYRGDLASCISDMGGDEHSIESARAYLGV